VVLAVVGGVAALVVGLVCGAAFREHLRRKQVLRVRAALDAHAEDWRRIRDAGRHARSTGDRPSVAELRARCGADDLPRHPAVRRPAPAVDVVQGTWSPVTWRYVTTFHVTPRQPTAPVRRISPDRGPDPRFGHWPQSAGVLAAGRHRAAA
jgi:hypothetical protein